MRPETLYKVYATIRLGRLMRVRDIADALGVSERTVDRYIKLLREYGYVEPVRRGMFVFYRVVKPLTEGEARRLVEGAETREPEVYELARMILDIIQEAGLRADLMGAAKIHMHVPSHSRITHDVDVVVAREHARILATMLRVSLNLELIGGGVHADYRFRSPVSDLKVDVMVDGFKEEGRLVWNLAPDLRRGSLTLEHAVAGKLTRRAFEYRSDAYDVAVSLPHIKPGRLLSLLNQMAPHVAERVLDNLEVVRKYISAEYTDPEAGILHRKLNEIEEIIRSSMGRENRRRTSRLLI